MLRVDSEKILMPVVYLVPVERILLFNQSQVFDFLNETAQGGILYSSINSRLLLFPASFISGSRQLSHTRPFFTVRVCVSPEDFNHRFMWWRSLIWESRIQDPTPLNYRYQIPLQVVNHRSENQPLVVRVDDRCKETTYPCSYVCLGVY